MRWAVSKAMLRFSGFFALVVLSGALARAEAPAGRYAVVDATVKDRRTTLVWRRPVSTDRLSWAAANAACAAIRGGTWRLPTVMELATLVDPRATASPTIDGSAFPDTPGVQFWTSTPYVRASGSYWTVDFATGATLGSPGSATQAVRCVQDAAVAPPP